MKKSYLDYMITFGIDNVMLKYYIEFLDDRKRKLDRFKELIEPYTIATHIEEITNRLVEVFNSEIAEVKLLRLLHDNKFNYKTKNRKFKFRLKLLKE